MDSKEEEVYTVTYYVNRRAVDRVSSVWLGIVHLIAVIFSGTSAVFDFVTDTVSALTWVKVGLCAVNAVLATLNFVRVFLLKREMSDEQSE